MFHDAEVVMECMIAATSVLQPDTKASEAMKQIALSDSTASRRADDLADNAFDQLIADIQKAEASALACDESTDKTDFSQMSVCVRMFGGNQFIEDLLALLSLPKQTRGEDVFSTLSEFFEKHKVDVKKMISLTTDGDPAMTERKNGLATRLKALQPKLLTYPISLHYPSVCVES